MEKAEEPGRILLINKPMHWTSFDVVNKLRYKLKIKKIGHAGTLDPLATGLLIVCVGKMTKRIEEFMGLEKEYTGKFILGKTTVSHDLETAVSEHKDIGHITSTIVEETSKQFVGIISQLPPQHSAIRIRGKRAYEFAREGRQIELAARQVTVSAFDITDVSLPEVSFRIICSKGTYIRSLARDFGNALQVGAYLTNLCRTRIGPFKLEDAFTIDQIS
jgi:tRNA pseudouridine55 synthase